MALVISQGIAAPNAGPEELLERMDAVRELAEGVAPASSREAREFIVQRLHSPRTSASLAKTSSS